MNKLIVTSAAVVLVAGCQATHQWGAEQPEWQENGASVRHMVRRQVANPNVIGNPPDGVVEAYDGQRTDVLIRAHRQQSGNAKSVEKPIQASSSGRLN